MKKIKNIFKNKVTRNASWMIIGRIYQMSLSFVVSMLTARYLGPSNYGLINYASSFTSFFSTFCVLGINSVIVKNFIAGGACPPGQGKCCVTQPKLSGSNR